MRRAAVLATVAALMLGAAPAGWVYHAHAHQPQVKPLPPEPAARIGGAFELVAHTGETVTDQDFLGRAKLVFFGFTNCPDVCPLSMQTLTLALEELENEADNVAVLFVTVDRERDTVAALADYVANFHPNVVGLTGSEDQIAAAARAYLVQYGPADAGEGSATDDYLVEHSAYIYLMGPDGTFVHAFHHAASADEIAGRLRRLLVGG